MEGTPTERVLQDAPPDSDAGEPMKERTSLVPYEGESQDTPCKGRKSGKPPAKTSEDIPWQTQVATIFSKAWARYAEK